MNAERVRIIKDAFFIRRFRASSIMSSCPTMKNVESVIDSYIETTVDALQNGNKVRLIGFGSFETRKRTVRIGVNPRSGERIIIPTSIIPCSKPGKNSRKQWITGIKSRFNHRLRQEYGQYKKKVHERYQYWTDSFIHCGKKSGYDIREVYYPPDCGGKAQDYSGV